MKKQIIVASVTLLTLTAIMAGCGKKITEESAISSSSYESSALPAQLVSVNAVLDMRDYYIKNYNDYFEINGIAIRQIKASEIMPLLNMSEYTDTILSFEAYSKENVTECTEHIEEAVQYALDDMYSDSENESAFFPIFELRAFSGTESVQLDPNPYIEKNDLDGLYNEIFDLYTQKIFTNTPNAADTATSYSTYSSSMENEELKSQWESDGDGNGISYKNADGTEYRLVVIDAAAGSRLYSLFSSRDKGQTINVVCDYPFGMNIGRAGALTFIDDNLCFAVLNNATEDYGNLYRSEDCGHTFMPIDLPIAAVKEDGKKITPFTLPGVPHLNDDGNLELECRQSLSISEYHNLDAYGVYTSKDNGLTWEYSGVKE